MGDIKEICKEPNCGREFTIEPYQQDFYKEKGWKLPKRCYDCRQKRKDQELSPFKDLKEKYNEHQAK